MPKTTPDAASAMYETGVLVENPSLIAQKFRQRMGYTDPRPEYTKHVEVNPGVVTAAHAGRSLHQTSIQNGAFDGLPPGQDPDTLQWQWFGMNPPPVDNPAGLSMVNSSWMNEASEFGGGGGTIQMLVNRHSQVLPLSKGESSYNEIRNNIARYGENYAVARRNPFTYSYAADSLGLPVTSNRSPYRHFRGPRSLRVKKEDARVKKEKILKEAAGAQPMSAADWLQMRKKQTTHEYVMSRVADRTRKLKDEMQAIGTILQDAEAAKYAGVGGSQRELLESYLEARKRARLRMTDKLRKDNRDLIEELEHLLGGKDEIKKLTALRQQEIQRLKEVREKAGDIRDSNGVAKDIQSEAYQWKVLRDYFVDIGMKEHYGDRFEEMVLLYGPRTLKILQQNHEWTEKPADITRLVVGEAAKRAREEADAEEAQASLDAEMKKYDELKMELDKRNLGTLDPHERPFLRPEYAALRKHKLGSGFEEEREDVGQDDDSGRIGFVSVAEGRKLLAIARSQEDVELDDSPQWKAEQMAAQVAKEQAAKAAREAEAAGQSAMEEEREEKNAVRQIAKEIDRADATQRKKNSSSRGRT